MHPSSGQPYYKLIGVLHGSKNNCKTRPTTEASMFVNLENSKNLYFIQRNQPSMTIFISIPQRNEKSTFFFFFFLLVNKLLIASGMSAATGRKGRVIKSKKQPENVDKIRGFRKWYK